MRARHQGGSPARGGPVQAAAATGCARPWSRPAAVLLAPRESFPWEWICQRRVLTLPACASPATHPFWLVENAPEQVIARVEPLVAELQDARLRLDVAAEHVAQASAAASRAETKRAVAAATAAAANVKAAELERALVKLAPKDAAAVVAAAEAKAKEVQAQQPVPASVPGDSDAVSSAVPKMPTAGELQAASRDAQAAQAALTAERDAAVARATAAEKKLAEVLKRMEGQAAARSASASPSSQDAVAGLRQELKSATARAEAAEAQLKSRPSTPASPAGGGRDAVAAAMNAAREAKAAVEEHKARADALQTQLDDANAHISVLLAAGVQQDGGAAAPQATAAGVTSEELGEAQAQIERLRAQLLDAQVQTSAEQERVRAAEAAAEAAEARAAAAMVEVELRHRAVSPALSGRNGGTDVQTQQMRQELDAARERLAKLENRAKMAKEEAKRERHEREATQRSAEALRIQLLEARQAAADAATAARASAAALPPSGSALNHAADSQSSSAAAMEMASLRAALATTQAQLKSARQRAQELENELAGAFDMRAELEEMQTRLSSSRGGRATPVAGGRATPVAKLSNSSGRITPSW